jgi:Natural resistance-associated macrophage protein
LNFVRPLPCRELPAFAELEESETRASEAQRDAIHARPSPGPALAPRTTEARRRATNRIAEGSHPLGHKRSVAIRLAAHDLRYRREMPLRHARRENASKRLKVERPDARLEDRFAATRGDALPRAGPRRAFTNESVLKALFVRYLSDVWQVAMTVLEDPLDGKVGPSLKRFIKRLGPGLITGASDDDPSGIGTYSQAGAQLGYSIGWTMLLTFPLMVGIQEISARIGRTTGHGISGNLSRHYPNWLLQAIVVLLFVANTINIGADLSAMADAAHLLFGGMAPIYVIAFTAICVTGIIFVNYKHYVLVLKWLTLSLFTYVAAVFAMHVNWEAAIAGTLVPHLNWTSDYFTTLVAIVGTTISPYLFFWQASQEAEDVRVDHARKPLTKAPRQAGDAFARIRADTLIGMALSNIIALAIIISTASVLHRAGARRSRPRAKLPKRSSRLPGRSLLPSSPWAS